MPGQIVEHAAHGENGVGSGQLFCPVVGFHHLLECIVPTGTVPGTFDGRYVLQFRDG